MLTKLRPDVAAVELAVVVPCFNERENVPILVDKLIASLDGLEWEVIFVDDDSPDGTSNVVRELAASNRRVRCIQRIGRRGLSTAVIEGMLATSAPYLAVIDGDLQHDERLLPGMLDTLKKEKLDVVVASRYLMEGGLGQWDASRVAMSTFATRLARVVIREPLSDPMSGFFMIRRPALERAVRRLSGQGFKILVDLFASTPEPYRFRELPYVFQNRVHGESKLDSFAAWEYLMLLLDKLIGWLIPVRLVMFAAVGATGVVVHLLSLRIAMTAFSFATSQAIATTIAMTSNFIINNVLTYRDRRLRGAKFFAGLLSFFAICGVGAIANVGIASAVFQQRYTWWISALAGIAVGLIWNYAVSSALTWRRP
ncbi:MAG: glycosyltransferase family 2 protein [Xanthobacteraceae bacterium]|nr:glycosyltransferase family 2 protein [Xanthobacteraceae bacterium]